jgi:hypothetical protein
MRVCIPVRNDGVTIKYGEVGRKALHQKPTLRSPVSGGHSIMASSTGETRTASARKAAIASWARIADDPAARAARTAPGRIASARRLLANLEAQARDGAT